MKKTELVFILDRSGSMRGLEKDTIEGFNGMLQKQRKKEGEVSVTTVLFDDKVEMLHNRVPLHDISDITEKDYYVRGCTALLDAVGQTIHFIENFQNFSSDKERAENVLFIITTDGYENASHEFSYDKIKKMIEIRSKEYHWEFMFLGANIDAIATAKNFGIDEAHASNYVADSKGTEINYDAMNMAISCCRSEGSIGGTWKQRIKMDYETRK